MSIEHGQGKAECAGMYECKDLRELVRCIVELADLCAESRLAGGNVWYELTVYVHRHGIHYQIERHGSVVGGETRHLPQPLLVLRELRQRPHAKA